MKVYGYCRVSTTKQNIERQERAIIALYPNAIIVKEEYTGRKLEGRDKFKTILNKVQSGDTIVFDSVSRMSRNATDGVDLYRKLYNDGINLVFLNERHIDTDVYRKAIEQQINVNIASGDTALDACVSKMIEALNEYSMALAERQIICAFEQAQKEVDDLSKRTKGGIETARLAGKQIGAVEGKKLTTKKSIAAKEIIMKHSRDFKGTLKDDECIKLIGCNRNSYYKYKKELAEQTKEKEA